MIKEPAFTVEPWCLRETRLDLDLLAQSESLFALSNGHIGLRGNLDEGEPHGIPGTYLNSFYELRSLPHAEAGYGYPESSQALINVTNGKLIRLLVEDEPFDVRYGSLRSHERVLDLRAGTLAREADWVSPAGDRVRVRSERLVSLTQRAVAAIRYEVEAVDKPVRVIVQSELVANEALPDRPDDPRASAALESPLVARDQDIAERSAVLVHGTRASGLQMAAGMDHVVDGPDGLEVHTRGSADWARTAVVCRLEPGQRLRMVKLLAYGWSSLRSRPALRDQVAAALTGAHYSGFADLLGEQRQYLDEFWDAADVCIEGDEEMQQAVRFALFHVLQAGARVERRGIGAKGLTGPGYDGHTFWDAETYVLPVLTYTHPRAAADALCWRHATLDLARHRAYTLGLRGAAFPWRTIRGQECSGYWPAGAAAVHVNADIANAVERYRRVTGDETLEVDAGLELLAETARLWLSLGHFDAPGRWHIAGVTGPDEYTALGNDNTYTNLAAADNLRAAAAAARRHPEVADSLGVGDEEPGEWQHAADSVYLPYDADLGVHPQCEGFTGLPEWDFQAYRDRYPLLLHAHYFELYRKQVVKQADLALAMLWHGDRFSPEDKARNVEYYERRTVRDSSLSACIQAVLAAEVGHLELAHDYAYEAALIDLHNLQHNSRDGLHLASLAGAWIAVVAGFGGLREHGGVLSFAPQLPRAITRLCFTIRWQGVRMRVDIDHDAVSYTLPGGSDASITLHHDGQPVTVTGAQPVTKPVEKRTPLVPRLVQPPGREPLRRSASHA